MSYTSQSEWTHTDEGPMQASQSGPTLKVVKCKSLRVEWTTGCFKNCPCEGDGWLKGQGEGQPNQYSARGRHVSQEAFTFEKLINSDYVTGSY